MHLAGLTLPGAGSSKPSEAGYFRCLFLTLGY